MIYQVKRKTYGGWFMALSPGIRTVLTASQEHQCYNKSVWIKPCFPTHQCQETINGSQQRCYASSWNDTRPQAAAFLMWCQCLGPSIVVTYQAIRILVRILVGCKKGIWREWAKGLCGGDRVVVWWVGGSNEGYAFSSVQETATVEPKNARVLSTSINSSCNCHQLLMTCQTLSLVSLVPLRKQQHISSIYHFQVTAYIWPYIRPTSWKSCCMLATIHIFPCLFCASPSRQVIGFPPIAKTTPTGLVSLHSQKRVPRWTSTRTLLHQNCYNCWCYLHFA